MIADAPPIRADIRRVRIGNRRCLEGEDKERAAKPRAGDCAVAIGMGVRAISL
jgi:hypothetical protein